MGRNVSRVTDSRFPGTLAPDGVELDLSWRSSKWLLPVGIVILCIVCLAGSTLGVGAKILSAVGTGCAAGGVAAVLRGQSDVLRVTHSLVEVSGPFGLRFRCSLQEVTSVRVEWPRRLVLVTQSKVRTLWLDPLSVDNEAIEMLASAIDAAAGAARSHERGELGDVDPALVALVSRSSSHELATGTQPRKQFGGENHSYSDSERK